MTALERQRAFRELERLVYALAVAQDEAGGVLEGELPLASRLMQVARRVRPQALALVRAAAHADGTTRPQVCAPQDNPLFHALLKAYGRRRGLSALLSTSFNEKGMPIAAAPDDALLTFARTDLDALALGRTLIEREDALDDCSGARSQRRAPSPR